MKKTTKRILSSLLAILLILTSVPFTAFAGEGDIEALSNAIDKYETKMDGTVYENMAPAYDAYATAVEYYYAYTYGGRTDLDIAGAANTLTSLANLNEDAGARNVMNKWTPYKGTATASFGNDSTELNAKYEGNNTNLLYSPAVPDINNATPAAQSTDSQVNEKGSGEHRVTIDMYYPKTVMLYDGETTPVMPVMARAKITKGKTAQLVTRYVHAIYVSKEANNNNDPDPIFAMNNALWAGSNGEADRNLNWPWTMTAENINGQPETHAVSGTNDELPNKLKLGSSGSLGFYSYYWAALANSIKYTGGDNAFNGAYYLQHFFNWRRFTGGDGADDYMGFTGGTTPIYVINYKALRDAVSNATSTVAGKVDESFKNKANISALLAAVNEATDADPNESFNNSNNIETNVTACANEISTNIAAINAISSATDSMSDYDSLAQAIELSKATYEAGNDDGNYSAESFAAFKNAYEASVAEAAAVADNGFTSATTASALVEAYNGLNTVIKPSGKTGTANYTFDEESGTLTITGPGTMADYVSGADSPFGNNDNIKTVIIGNDVEGIGANAFAGANGIETITVPAGLTYGEGAFDNCTKLHTVIITDGALTYDSDSTPNAPWMLQSVQTVKLGKDENDRSVSKVGDGVFSNTRNQSITYYFYFSECEIENGENATRLGASPTVYGYVQSTAATYADAHSNVNFSPFAHTHEFETTGVEKTAPTCTQPGVTTYKCKYCSFTEDRKEPAALGHSWVESTVPPTCTERGYTLKTCTVCSISIKENYVDATNHNYDLDAIPENDYSNVTITDTQEIKNLKHYWECQNSGCDYKKYKSCDFKFKETSDNYNIYECAICGGTYRKAIASATGYTVTYLDVDNNYLGEESVEDGGTPNPAALNIQLPPSADGHIYKWSVNRIVVGTDLSNQIIHKPTIIKIVDELVKYTVTYYDEDDVPFRTEDVSAGEYPQNIPDLPSPEKSSTDDNMHNIYTWDKNPAETAITEDDMAFRIVATTEEHTFEDIDVTPAKCFEDGSKTIKCKDCGYTVSGVVIPAIGHHTIVTLPGKPATCTEPGITDGEYCSVCQNTITPQTGIPLSGHTWDDGVITKQPTIYETGVKTYTCGVCHKTKTESIPKATISEITPSDAEANNAQINNSIQRPAGITTVSNSKKKQLIISFNKVPGAQNYRVMYRGAGESWKYAWTNGTTTYTLKNLKNKGLYEFMFAAYTKNAKGQWERGQYSYTAYRYYYKAKLKKVKGAKKKITVTWKKDKNASGYQLYYSKNKNFTGAKKIEIKSGKKTKYTIKKLKKGKYYVRIRAIKKKGNTYTGEYSKRKAVKVK